MDSHDEMKAKRDAMADVKKILRGGVAQSLKHLAPKGGSASISIEHPEADAEKARGDELSHELDKTQDETDAMSHEDKMAASEPRPDHHLHDAHGVEMVKDMDEAHDAMHEEPDGDEHDEHPELTAALSKIKKLKGGI